MRQTIQDVDAYERSRGGEVAIDKLLFQTSTRAFVHSFEPFVLDPRCVERAVRGPQCIPSVA